MKKTSLAILFPTAALALALAGCAGNQIETAEEMTAALTQAGAPCDPPVTDLMPDTSIYYCGDITAGWFTDAEAAQQWYDDYAAGRRADSPGGGIVREGQWLAITTAEGRDTLDAFAKDVGVKVEAFD